MRTCVACWLAVTATLPAAAAPTDELTWFAGCWAAERGDAGSGEIWTAPGGATVLGASRTVRGGQTVAHEFMLIVDGPQGLVFTAWPSAKPAASFRAVRVEARRVTFENAEKDFPQRVTYESPDDDTLIGYIEGQQVGRERRIDYPMKRVPCPSGAR